LTITYCDLLHHADSWALDQEGQFYRSVENAPSVRLWHQIEDRSDVLLGDAIQTCRELTKEEVLLLKRPACKKSSNPERVRRMLYVFLKDLLASPIAGMILEKKSLRDRFYCDGTSFPAYNYHLTGKPLGPFAKLMVLIILCGLMVVMLGYVLTFAALHPSQLQRAWLYGLYTWAIVDCALISSFEVLIQQVLIPSIIKADLRTAVELVMDLIPGYTEKVRQDHLVRTAMTDPVQVHNGKAVEVPDEQPQEQRIHSITDLFFVTARIAEHEHESAQARFMHFYNTMKTPGAIFPRQRWYRPLYPALERATRKFKNPSLFTRTLGHGYRSLFRLDLPGKILKHLLVAYLYAPIWLQDTLLQFVLVVVLGILLLVAYTLYRVQGYLIAIPLVLLLIAFLVYRFFDALRKMCVFLWGVSNRVRPVALPTAYAEPEEFLNTSAKSVAGSGRVNRIDRIIAADVESAHPSPVTSSAALSSMQPAETAPLGAHIDASLSPNRPPKHLPQRSSPHHRSGTQFFAEEASADEAQLARGATLAAVSSDSSGVVGVDLALSSSLDMEAGGGAAEERKDADDQHSVGRSQGSLRGNPQDSSGAQGAVTVESPRESLPTANDTETAGAPAGREHDSSSAVQTTPTAARSRAVRQVSDEWESSHSDDDLGDLPRSIIRSLSTKAPAAAPAGAGFALHAHRDATSPSVGELATASPTMAVGASPPAASDAGPALRVQNLFSPGSAASLRSNGAGSPAQSLTSHSVLPLSLVARSVESEEDDSDYEEYGPDDVSRESFDEPTEQLGLY
jgi:hypothetical protein